MKFCSLVLELHLPQNFCHTLTDSQTDKYFPEIVKSCSGHPKTCKLIKNRKYVTQKKVKRFTILCSVSVLSRGQCEFFQQGKLKYFVKYLKCTRKAQYGYLCQVLTAKRNVQNFRSLLWFLKKYLSLGNWMYRFKYKERKIVLLLILSHRRGFCYSYTKKSGVALTQLSLTLHYSRRLFY